MKQYLRSTLLISGLAMTASCSDSNNDQTEPAGGQNGAESNYTEIVLNASAGGFGAAPDSADNHAVYFNLDSGETVSLSDEEARLSDAWHVGFKRTTTLFNSGSSGPGETQSALIAAQTHYYSAEQPDNNVFLNAVAADEAATLEQAVRGDAEFVTDAPSPVITSDGGDGSWWQYNPSTHTLSAASDNWSIIRGAAGDSYAKMHVTAIDTAARGVTVELFVQAASQSTFSATATQWVATIGAAGGALCYDVDSGSEADCDSAAASWDLRLEISSDGRDWTLWTNGGAYGSSTGGAALAGLSAEAITAYPGASDVPGFFADNMSNAVKASPWYAYNLSEQHLIWPNYRVYAVDTGSHVYKIQLSGYYHPDSGDSGHITLRYAALN